MLLRSSLQNFAYLSLWLLGSASLAAPVNDTETSETESSSQSSYPTHLSGNSATLNSTIGSNAGSPPIGDFEKYMLQGWQLIASEYRDAYLVGVGAAINDVPRRGSDPTMGLVVVNARRGNGDSINTVGDWDAGQIRWDLDGQPRPNLVQKFERDYYRDLLTMRDAYRAAVQHGYANSFELCSVQRRSAEEFPYYRFSRRDSAKGEFKICTVEMRSHWVNCVTRPEQMTSVDDDFIGPGNGTQIVELS